MSKGLVTACCCLLFCTSASGFSEKSNNTSNNVLKNISLAGSRQGQSVGVIDVDGDGIDDKVVGAPYASSPRETGAVLVYKGDSHGRFASSPSKLLMGDDNYGFTFANLGDVDGDGHDDLAVGAIHGDGADVSLSGSVVVYKGGRNWNYDNGRGKIIARLSGEGPMDKFGYSVAAADLDGDGKKDLIVGAPFNTSDPSLYQGGAVYVYFAPGFNRKVALPASSSNKGLGWSVAAGNINGDNIADLCISAGGKALCYYGSSTFNPSLNAPDVTITGTSAGFGKALAVIGDTNADGFGELVIGAPNAVINGNRDTGSVFVVKGGTGKRTVSADAPSAELLARINGSSLFDRFGSSIISISHDQYTGFAVGSPMADIDASNQLSGKVYLFRDGAMTMADSIVFTGFTRDQGFGTALAAAQNKLLIGAPRTQGDTGAVSVVDLPSGN